MTVENLRTEKIHSESRKTLTVVMGSPHKISSYYRIMCKLDVIEIQLCRLQVYNLHQVRSHLKDLDVILKNRTKFDTVNQPIRFVF